MCVAVWVHVYPSFGLPINHAQWPGCTHLHTRISPPPVHVTPPPQRNGTEPTWSFCSPAEPPDCMTAWRHRILFYHQCVTLSQCVVQEHYHLHYFVFNFNFNIIFFFDHRAIAPGLNILIDLSARPGYWTSASMHFTVHSILYSSYTTYCVCVLCVCVFVYCSHVCAFLPCSYFVHSGYACLYWYISVLPHFNEIVVAWRDHSFNSFLLLFAYDIRTTCRYFKDSLLDQRKPKKKK